MSIPTVSTECAQAFQDSILFRISSPRYSPFASSSHGGGAFLFEDSCKAQLVSLVLMRIFVLFKPKLQGLSVAQAGICSPPGSISLMLGFLMKEPCTSSVHFPVSLKNHTSQRPCLSWPLLGKALGLSEPRQDLLFSYSLKWNLLHVSSCPKPGLPTRCGWGRIEPLGL